MTPDWMMTRAAQFEPPESFVDPRTLAGFQSGHWPACDGHDGPAIGTQDRHERRCIEFLAAYYQINCRHAELAMARGSGAADEELRVRLAAVEAALRELDELEDRYAPVGFYGEPQMNGLHYQSISFYRPELPRVLPEASSISSHLAVPGLGEFPKEELDGPVVVTRWTYGKVDL
jgi:hypothetical protein